MINFINHIFFLALPFQTNISRTSHRSASSASGRRSTSRTRGVRPTTTTKTINSNGNTSNEFESEDEEKVDEIDSNESDLSDPLELARRQHLHDQLKREELELTKLGRGIGQVFLTNLKDREKRLREYRIDPRNASRTPSARLELPRRLRYDNPVNACKYSLQLTFNFLNELKSNQKIYLIKKKINLAPSRDLDNYKWDDEELDQYSLYRGTNTRSSNYTTTPFNGLYISQ